MAVEFRTIGRFPGYRFGSDGSVWSCWQRFAVEKGFPVLKRETSVWRRLTPSTNSGGYPSIRLCSNGGSAAKCTTVHRLILEAFKGPCPVGMEACHNDGDRSNCAISNLRWDSRSANQMDRHGHGTALVGREHPRPTRRLTETDVVSIRALYAQGVKQVVLAKRFGMSKTGLHAIVHRRSWGWL